MSNAIDAGEASSFGDDDWQPSFDSVSDEPRAYEVLYLDGEITRCEFEFL